MRLHHLLIPTIALAACTRGADDAAPADTAATETVAISPPVPVDPVPAIEYPDDVADTLTSATVRLRLFVDEQGNVVPDSTRVAESSGIPALDSAAVAGSSRLDYAPALRGDSAVATHFVQPVEFTRPRRPE